MEKLLGKTVEDFAFGEWIPGVLKLRQELEKTKQMRGEVKGLRKDGTVVWTQYSATPMYDDQGNYVANFAMHTDITERKLAEEALAQTLAQARYLSRQLLDLQEQERRALGVNCTTRSVRR